MKRSKKLTLAMLGLSGAAPLMLTGCGQPAEKNKPLYYPDITSCIKEGVVTEAECRLEYNKAWQHHLMNAPRYKAISDCQFDFKSSSCQQLASGEYIPTMEGYLLYSELTSCPVSVANITQNQQSQAHSGRSLNIVPVYIDNSSQSTYNTGNTQRTQGSQQKESTKASSDNSHNEKSSIKTTTKKRGGFGSKAAARGSWGT